MFKQGTGGNTIYRVLGHLSTYCVHKLVTQYMVYSKDIQDIGGFNVGSCVV